MIESVSIKIFSMAVPRLFKSLMTSSEAPVLKFLRRVLPDR